MKFYPAGPLRKLIGGSPAGGQWAILLVLSIVLVAGLEALRLPAALLIGPMIAGIVVASAEGELRVPNIAFCLAQGTVGSMIARSIPFDILGEVLRDWPLFLSGVLSVIAVSAVLGWMLARRQVLPGSTAIWGSAPGAATAMTVMSAAYGADMRLVAVMQFLRVVCVVIAASVVARLFVGDAVGQAGGAAHAAAQIWFPPLAGVPFLETLALIAVGVAVGLRLRIPGGSLLLPLFAGIVLKGAAGMTIELPPWFLAISYAVIGWSIGLRFTRPILVHAARALPRLLLSILALIALCGVFAAVLVVVAGIDPLTAYLATSPGGVDSVAIIAASSNVDAPFVMAMQTARMIVVTLTGPALARFVAERMGMARKSA